MALKLNVQSLVESLPIVSENILEEAAIQPLLFLNAARYRVATMKLRSRASIDLDSFRSKVARTIRKQKDKMGQKVTEGTIREIVETHSQVRQKWEAYEEAIEREELAKLVMEAFRMRSSAIKIIAEANMYEGAETGSELSKIMHKKLAKKAHELLDKQQHQED